MPYRWSIGPVATFPIDIGESIIENTICPKEHTYIDPGRGKRYMRVSIYNVNKANRTWAISLLYGVDFTPLNNDAEIANLFEVDFTDSGQLLDMTPAQLGWPNARLNRIRNRITAKGGDASGLTNTTPLITWIMRLATILNPFINLRKIFILGL